MEGDLRPADERAPSERVSLVVPIRNEGLHIDECLRSITLQTYPKRLLEVIVVDGDSDDDTLSRLNAWAERDPRIRVLRNPERLMVPGLNLGIAASSGDYIGCVSGHSELPAEYVLTCVRLLQRHDAWGAGAGIERRGATPLQRAIGRAQSHPFGVGDASHNYATRSGWAEAIFPGFWPRWVFDRVGNFDKRMASNEDNEFSHRIRSAGGRLWYEPALRIGYFPRRTLGGLFRQYFQYGRGKAAVFREHPNAVRVRHLVPAALVAALMVGSLLTPLTPLIAIVTAAIAGVYVAVAIAVALSAAKRGEPPLLLALAFVVMHLAYGLGMWFGLVREVARGSQRGRQAA